MKKLTLVILFCLLVAHVFAQRLELKWKTDTLLRVPESVFFDNN